MAWSLTSPPNFVKGTAVATKKGWQTVENNGEVIVALGNLNEKAEEATIQKIEFVESPLRKGDEVAVRVYFTEYVSADAGAFIDIEWDDESTEIRLYALAQENTHVVLFDKVVGLNAPVLLPADVPANSVPGASTLSVPAQTVSGTFEDIGSAKKAKAKLTATDNFIEDEVVVVGGVTYTFKNTVTTTANQIKVGATLRESLSNLSAAVNLSGAVGQYGSATVIHPTVTSYQHVDGILFEAKTAGVAGNSLASTTTAVDASFPSATFALGADDVTSDSVISAPFAATLAELVVNEASIESVVFNAASYERSAPLSLTVTFSESVTVTAGASIVVAWSGVGADVSVYALGQTGTEIVFDQVVGLNEAATVPNEAGTASIAAQTLGGTIEDSLDANANKRVIAATATAAGERVVA